MTEAQGFIGMIVGVIVVIGVVAGLMAWGLAGNFLTGLIVAGSLVGGGIAVWIGWLAWTGRLG